MHASFLSTLLLALASTVTSLSLSDLESIPSDAVTPGCYTAYNQEIAACPDAASFKAKTPCSTECQDALASFSEDTILSCRQAFVSPGSLLRKLLDNGLVITLCPASSSSSAAATTSTSSTSSSSTQAAIKTKTESSTSTFTTGSVSFSGFMTITASSAASTASVPTQLTLDESAEPTGYDGYAAYAVESGSGVVSAAQSSATALNGSPFEAASPSSNTTMDSSAASSARALWGTIAVGVAFTVGAVLV